MAAPPGERRHKIDIQQKSMVPDGQGCETTVWVAYLPQIWARVLSISGKQAMENMALQAKVSHQVNIRYQPGILPGQMRVVYNNRVFQIQNVLNPEERNIELNMLCIEMVGVAP